MKGRKRKPGPRHPNGDLREQQQAGVAPSAARRMIDMASARAADQRCGTPLGRMLLAGEITPQVYDAGDKYARLRARADAIDGIPARSARGIDMNRTGGRSGGDGEAIVDTTACRELRVARSHLLDPEREAIEWIACDDNWPETYSQKLALKIGLERLASLWCLTGRREPVNSRNAR